MRVSTVDMNWLQDAVMKIEREVASIDTGGQEPSASFKLRALNLITDLHKALEDDEAPVSAELVQGTDSTVNDQPIESSYTEHWIPLYVGDNLTLVPYMKVRIPLPNDPEDNDE